MPTRLTTRNLADLMILPRSRWLLLVASALTIIALEFHCEAAEPSSARGTSSRQAQQQAVANLPYHQLSDAARNKLDQVLQRPSFYRCLPVTSIDVEPDHFQFLVRYPEVVVNIWQLMGITQMSATRTGPFSLDTNDGAGTISSAELVYGSQNLHIFYCTGSYEGTVLKKKLTGRCVLILRTNYDQSRPGQSIATNRLDVFLKLDNATVSMVAKTIQPLVAPTADHNFTESLKFVQRLNETTRTNGPGVQQMAKRFQIDASVRQEYVDVVDDVFQRAMEEQSPAAAPARVMVPTSFQSNTNPPASSADPVPQPEQVPIVHRVRLTDGVPVPGSYRNRGYMAPSYSSHNLPTVTYPHTAREIYAPQQYYVR